MPKNQVKPTSQLKIFKILKQTLLCWKEGFGSFTKIILVLAIPAMILSILQTQELIGEYGLLMSIAWSFVFIAIILLASRQKHLSGTKLSAVFTMASSRLLQYVGVSLILLFFLASLLIGVYGIVFVGPLFNLPIYLFVPIGLAGIVIGAYLLSRYCLAQSIAVLEPRSIIGSLNESAQLTKKSRLRILFGYMGLIAVLLALLLTIQFVLSIDQAVNENIIIYGLVYIIEVIVFVPILLIFQVKVYEDLSEKKRSSKKSR